MPNPETKFEIIKARIKNNPILASLMALGMVVIALSAFTDAAQNLLRVVMPERRPNINGEWVANASYPWLRAAYTETFSFSGSDNDLRGTASYLGKKQVIVEGTVDGDQIEFKTKTIEYAPDWGNNKTKLATHHYHGRVQGDEIQLVMETYGGYSSYPPIELTARRKPDKT